MILTTKIFLCVCVCVCMCVCVCVCVCVFKTDKFERLFHEKGNGWKEEKVALSQQNFLKDCSTVIILDKMKIKQNENRMKIK